MGVPKTSRDNMPKDPDPPPAGTEPRSRPARARGRQDFGAQRDLHLDPITRNLRRAFDEVAAEPLPDDLMELLKQIDEAPLRNQGQGTGGDHG